MFINTFIRYSWEPSQADVAVFEALNKVPTAATSHLLRWYNHIKSYEHSSLPGEKSISALNKDQSNVKELEDNFADDDVDLFGSDEEDDKDAAKIREERLKAYAEKKSKKPALIAKSSIVIDVKPWDDETNMSEMEKVVRSIEMDGLVWGACKYLYML